MIREIEDRFAEPLDLGALAAEVNLSRSRLSHIFREETGTSPLRYIRRLRMERARTLLERTFLSVKQVMAEVGCSDPSHFTRDFRHYHGMPPRAWRTGPGGARREGAGDAAPAADDRAGTEQVQRDSPTNRQGRQRRREP